MGISYAATSSPRVFVACANAPGALRLLDAKGKCPAGAAKVTLNQAGVAGPRGATGAPGAPGSPGSPGSAGSPGASGPGAIPLALNNVGGKTETAAVAIGSTGLTAHLSCNGQQGVFWLKGPGGYRMRGTTFAKSTGGGFNGSSSSSSQDIAAGLNFFYAFQSADNTGQFGSGLFTSGQMDVNVVVDVDSGATSRCT